MAKLAKTWKSLSDAERATKREFGADSELFYYYQDRGHWKRSLAAPPGAKKLKDPTSGRAIVDMSRADRSGHGFNWSIRQAPGYLYHLTSSQSYLKIRREGLRAGAAQGIATGTGSDYTEYSQGGVFLTDAAGLLYWSRNQLVKYGERVLLRTKAVDKCTVDPHGTRDARKGSGKKTTAYKCTKEITPADLEVFDAQENKWRSVSDVRLSTTEETILEKQRNPVAERMSTTASRLYAIAARLAEGG